MSKLLKAVVATAKDLKLDTVTMRELDALALPEVIKLTPRQIKNIRAKAHVSQGVMARYLNISPSTYQKWERGEVTPGGGNLKLLNLAYRHGLESIA
ncbi:helix-turn-helix domain-containing protein [Oceanicoccus sagamiensis]|uniref:Transcriptional regulator n=1 Tax=Oceanicoccus sagamiensis TaxID=716816 RepID=A0A1X9NIH8_9GAMM|nr:helix-turn-helix domain-containing protein [Oceanicoccus sagamiensis]ARN74697.1 transcriptional regulator [Oceanicoccus sagamiensis]